MKINLAYGKKGLEWNVPDGYHVDIIEPQWVEGLKDQDGSCYRSPEVSHKQQTLEGTCEQGFENRYYFQ